MSEVEIKLIRKDSDISNRYKLDWDTYIGDKPVDVYRIEGFYHAIGGKHGNNDLWCCDRGEEPTFENLIEFDGEPVCWGLRADSRNYSKYRWDEKEVNHSNSVTITRNGKDFYTISCRDLYYGLAKAQVLMTELTEHPLNFFMQDYLKDIIGRKILWKDIPAVITHWCDEQACVIIEPVDPNNSHPDFREEGFVKEEIFSSSIWWWESRED